MFNNSSNKNVDSDGVDDEQRTTFVCLGFCGIFVRQMYKLYKLFGASNRKFILRLCGKKGREGEEKKKSALFVVHTDYFMWIECWFYLGRPSYRFCFHMLLIIEITKHKHANPNTYTHSHSPNSNQICAFYMEKNSTIFSHQIPSKQSAWIYSHIFMSDIITIHDFI